MRLRAVLVGLVLCLAGGAAPALAAGSDAQASKVCLECHDSEDLPEWAMSPHATRPPPQTAAAMRGSAMSAADDARTPSCISCHGPSVNHVTRVAGAKERGRPDIVFGKKTAVPPAERSAVCMTCHQKDNKLMLWAGSPHQDVDLACNSCHRVHTNRDKVLVRATQADTCIGCHKEQRTQMAKPSHHPVPEGKMSCSDCHNVHGSAGPKLAKRDSINDTCYTCHAEKRGPFVHSHEPVNEDCSTCHNPHGSTVAAMLKSRPPMLCQQCHTPHVAGGVGAVGGQRGVFGPAAPGQLAPAVSATSNGKNVVNLWQGRSCMNCHTQVHGSNNPSTTNPSPSFLTR
jgi:DmsE family decaheme c-type cytochrome